MKRMTTISTIAMLTACAGLTGCRLNDPDTGAKSEPVKAEPKAPAKPAMGSGGSVMFYPTGNRETSALALERMAPSEVVAGQEFAYEYRITNLTNMELKDVMLKDDCASGFSIVSSEPKAMGTATNPSWGLGNFAPGQSKMVKLIGKANVTGGVLTSCAMVSYNSLLCVTTNVVQPALKVTVSAPEMKTSCEDVCVTIVVSNPGTGVAKNTMVNYTVPAGWTAKGATKFTAGDLPAGQSMKAEVCLTPSKTGSFNSQASATAEGNLSAQSNVAATKIVQPKLEITADCPGSTLIGRTMTYKFTVKNTGDFSSLNTVVNAPVPAGTTFVSADMNGAAAPGAVSWNLGELKSGESKSVSMTLRNSGAGSVAVSATTSGACAPQVGANCSTNVMGVPDIGTLLTDDDGVVLINDPHTFRYEVKNQGQIDLTSLKVVFKLDEGMEFVSSTSSTAAKVSGKNVEFALGTLKPGDKLAFTITTKGLKEGNLVITSETTAAETKKANRNDEQVNYIGR